MASISASLTAQDCTRKGDYWKQSPSEGVHSNGVHRPSVPRGFLRSWKTSSISRAEPARWLRKSLAFAISAFNFVSCFWRQELFEFLAPGAPILGDVRDVWILLLVFLQLLVFLRQEGFESSFSVGPIGLVQPSRFNSTAMLLSSSGVIILHFLSGLVLFVEWGAPLGCPGNSVRVFQVARLLAQGLSSFTANSTQLAKVPDVGKGISTKPLN